MITIDVKTDERYFKRMRRELYNQHKFKRVLNSAERRATHELRSKVSDAISQQYTAAEDTIDKRLKVSRKGTSIELSADTRRLALHQFKHFPKESQGRRHLEVEIRRGRVEDRHPSFILPSNPETGIFQRVGKNRYPIKFQFGLSTYKMAENPVVYDSVTKLVADKIFTDVVKEIL